MKLPAYGRDLIALRQRGVNPAWLCVSLGFALGRAMPRVVVPDDTEVWELDLRCVAGLSCLIAHDGKPTRALDIAELALKSGATLATIHDKHTGKTTTTAEVMAIRGRA